MKRLSLLSAALILAAGSTASAQVVVRAPFVRVEVGPGGTFVRAPFVRYYAGPPLYVAPPPGYIVPGTVPGYAPGFAPGLIAPPGLRIAPPIDVPQVGEAPQVDPVAPAAPANPKAVPAPAAPRPMPLPKGDIRVPAFPPPQPGLPADFVPPPPAKAAVEMTLEKFAKSFTAKEGAYEVTLVNPVTKMPTTVRFTLPAGQPDVQVAPASITYRYAGRSMVKIEFDADGATVTSR